MSSNVLIIIPARGGSKGIPRKNLRPLKNKPLIYYSIQNSLKSNFNPTVYVSSEDEEILNVSKRFGAKVIKRSKKFSEDTVTLDPVIFDAYQKIKAIEKKKFEIIVTLQPTSPLLKTTSLDNAIKLLIENEKIDTIISGINDTHLTWKYENGTYTPNYQKRVNRQELPPIFKETGSFLITRSSIISENSRIGSSIFIHELSQKEAIDIDSFEDWSLCEYYLKKRKILFVVEGYHEIGLGHVYNSLSIAHEILDHEVLFLTGPKSKMAHDKIKESNYTVYSQRSSNILEDIINIGPDVVINDKLDNGSDYVLTLKRLGIKVVSIEDLGDGAKHADLVINAIYPEHEILPNHYFGHKYFVLRDEFLYAPKKVINKYVKSILLSFGGVDPNNLTAYVLESIYQYCLDKDINIEVVTGKGYVQFKSLKKFKGISIHRNVSNISEYMVNSDIIFTSAGRTTFEIASTATPSIVLAQNERELTHFFASEEYGFINLGLGKEITKEEILRKFDMLCNNYESRILIHQRMKKFDLRNSKKRVITLIYKLINEIN